MCFSARLPRLVLWTMVAVLLFKAAAPVLARAAAWEQNLPVVEVCTVYGLQAFSLNGTEPVAPADEPATPLHGDERCVLSVVLAAAAPGVACHRLAMAPAVALRLRPALLDWHVVPDRHARWLAQRQHSPPTV